MARFLILLASSLAVLICIHMQVNGDPMDIDEMDTSGTPVEKNVPKIFDYGKYVEAFKKNYSPIETLNKAKLFFGRTLKIFQHNVLFHDKKKRYFLGQNQFTDMTPEELKRYNAQQDPEMRPVEEALKNPDLPASSSITVSRIKNKGKDIDSQAGLDDLMEISSAEGSAKARTSKPVVNFMDGKGINDLKSVLDRLEERPDLANQLAKVIEHDQDLVKLEEQKNLEEATKRNKIQFRPVPKSNNKNYDPETIISYGSSRSDVYEGFAKNYAKFLMSDPNDFGFDLTPYESPKSNEEDEEEEEVIAQVNESISPLTSLFGSMKSIYDFFTLDDYDESQDVDVAPTNVQNLAAGVIDYDIDWRKTGCITRPSNQKECNACYAFTTLALMEFFHCRQTKQLTEFSPQYIVDCGQKNDLHGCQGGKLGNVGNFIRSYGVELAATYPYTARENQCQIEDDQSEKSGYLRPQITAWQSFPSIGAWYKWLPKSPIIVGISMPSDFFGYAGGIHDGSSCDEKSVHAMLLVGSGTQDGQEFWLLKNSYSDIWGESGYFRLSKAAPMRCFNSAVVARPKFV